VSDGARLRVLPRFARVEPVCVGVLFLASSGARVRVPLQPSLVEPGQLATPVLCFGEADFRCKSTCASHVSRIEPRHPFVVVVLVLCVFAIAGPRVRVPLHVSCVQPRQLLSRHVLPRALRLDAARPRHDALGRLSALRLEPRRESRRELAGSATSLESVGPPEVPSSEIVPSGSGQRISALGVYFVGPILQVGRLLYS